MKTVLKKKSVINHLNGRLYFLCRSFLIMDIVVDCWVFVWYWCHALHQSCTESACFLEDKAHALILMCIFECTWVYIRHKRCPLQSVSANNSSIQPTLTVTGRWQQTPVSDNMRVTQGLISSAVYASNYRVIKPQASCSAVEADCYL